MDKSPDAFRTISEAAEDLGLPQHVLRFWETRFPQIKPLKRGGGRRYYRPDDVEILRAVKQLLYDEGYTIKGVQRLFKEQGARAVVSINHGKEAVAPASEAEVSLGERSELTARSNAAESSTPRAEPPNVTSAQAALSTADLQSLRNALAEINEGERILALARAG
jgi:DNA-binding transcriptional MerR regulator